jgi:hypothetical protein
MDCALFGSIVLLGLGLGFNAEACSTDGWAGGTSNIPANGQAASPPGVSRYSEFCALAITGQAHVQSNFAVNESQYRARFYVLDSLTGAGTVDIFEAYSDEGGASPLFKISFNGSQFTFDATDAGGGSDTVSAASGWNLVEFDWNSDGNTFSYWVNLDATTEAANGSVNAGAGTVDSVRVGAPNGFGGQSGSLVYDAFESHRTTPVGALLNCDAQGDVDIDINDALAIVDEVFGNPTVLATGQPDCDLNGEININDVLAVVDIVF